KKFIEAPTGGAGATCMSCAHCTWMAMNGLENLAQSLTTGQNEIFVEEKIRQQALKSVSRMIDFAKNLSK
ncbi:MAG: quinolinate synthase NadA, partial [Gammaproteobacteria bacterium]|nr:quinolinate synthase NadA [Gammaproteobacteria bacterium]